MFMTKPLLFFRAQQMDVATLLLILAISQEWVSLDHPRSVITHFP